MLRVTMWAGLREVLWGGLSLGRTVTEPWVRVKRSATLRLAKEAKVLPASGFCLLAIYHLSFVPPIMHLGRCRPSSIWSTSLFRILKFHLLMRLALSLPSKIRL
jgi:hypothetical protein